MQSWNQNNFDCLDEQGKHVTDHYNIIINISQTFVQRITPLLITALHVIYQTVINSFM